LCCSQQEIKVKKWSYFLDSLETDPLLDWFARASQRRKSLFMLLAAKQKLIYQQLAVFGSPDPYFLLQKRQKNNRAVKHGLAIFE
jgi:hypothetical protein